MLRPVYDDAPAASTATSRSRSTPTLARDTDETLAQAREYWARVDRPNLMIKIPGTPEGVAGDRAGDLRRASTSTSRCCSASRRTATVAEAYIAGLERRARRGQARSTSHSVASFFVSRVDTEVDKRLEELGSTTSCAGKAGSPTPAPPTSASRRSSTASASPRCAAQGAARAAAAVGLDRRRRTPPTPTRCTSTGWSAPRPSTRCRWRRCWPPATHGEVDRRRTARRGPGRRAATPLAERRHRHGRRHRQAAARRRRRVRRRRWRSCSPASSPSARRRHHRPAATIEALAARRARARAIAAPRRRRPRGERRPAHLGQGRHAVGRPAHAEVADRLGWLTIAEQMLEAARRPARVRRGSRATTASPTACCSAWAARRSRPRSSGARSATADGALRPARARLDRRRRGRRRCERRGRPRQDAVPRLLEVRRHDRDAARCSRTSTSLRPDGRAVRGDHRPGLRRWRRSPQEHGFRRVFPNDPDIGGRYSALSHFGARAGGADGRRRRGAARAGRDRRAALPTRRRRPATRRRCGSGSRSASWRWAAATSSRSSIDEPLGSLRAVGRAARRRVAPASTARASCRSPTSRSATPDDYGDDRVFLHLQHAERARRRARRRRRRRSRDAGHPVIVRPVRRRRRPRRVIFFFAEFAIAVAGLGARDQPVRPAQRAGGQGPDGRDDRGVRARRAFPAADAAP